jgi:16S rRNA (cytidine1402-2'-O)-methyltransferase
MGKLFIVSTPIGNLEDITIRAIKTLFTVDAILCEDTRHTGLLMQECVRRYHELFDFNPDWKPKYIAYYDEIEEKVLPEVIQRLSGSENLALVSDAGTPLISDPGYRLVSECKKRNIEVISIPGPSAVLAALTSSGIPMDKFFFLGYPPEKPSQRLKTFQSLLQCFKTLKQNPTYVFYCAPHKLIQTLIDMQAIFGDIPITVARELTKIHEEVWNGTISQALQKFTGPKGEIVLLFKHV